MPVGLLFSFSWLGLMIVVLKFDIGIVQYAAPSTQLSPSGCGGCLLLDMTNAANGFTVVLQLFCLGKTAGLVDDVPCLAMKAQ